MGLQLISDSYLDVMRQKAEAAGLPFEPRMMDGKHYKALIDDVRGGDADLVIMGALGLGAVKDSQLRLGDRAIHPQGVRRHPGDPQPGADGGPAGGHRGGAGRQPPVLPGAQARASPWPGTLKRPLQAVAVYDPYLHYAMFNGIVGVLSEKASKVFRFKEQEQLHEEVIDTGLAKIYQSHLEIGRKLAKEDGVDLSITLLGRQVLREAPPVLP